MNKQKEKIKKTEKKTKFMKNYQVIKMMLQSLKNKNKKLKILLLQFEMKLKLKLNNLDIFLLALNLKLINPNMFLLPLFLKMNNPNMLPQLLNLNWNNPNMFLQLILYISKIQFKIRIYLLCETTSIKVLLMHHLQVQLDISGNNQSK